MSSNQLQNITREQNKVYEQVLTGTVLNRGSDDPVIYNESEILSRTESRIEQYQRNIVDAKNFLQKMDVIFGSAIDSVHIAKQDITRAATETLSETDRKIIADTLAETIDQLISFANERHLERHLFSGQKIDEKPIEFENGELTYNGNNKNMHINISENMDVEVTQGADVVFGDLINSLYQTEQAIRNNDTDAISEASALVDDAFEEFIDNRSRVGVQLKSVETMESAYTDTLTDLEIKKEDSLGIELAKVFGEFKQLEYLYQSAIHSTLTMENISVLNFL